MYKKYVEGEKILLYEGSELNAKDDYFSASFEESMPIYKTAIEECYAKFLVAEPAKVVFRKIL